MTAREVLEKVIEAGGKVIPDPARPRLVVPSELKPLVAEHREEIRALVLQGATEETVPPCGSPACKSCYEIPGGRIHPPRSSEAWESWRAQWQPGKERLQ